MILTADIKQALKDIAMQAAKSAAKLIQSNAGQIQAFQSKPNHTSPASQVLTKTDFESQEVILSHLTPTCEKYGIGMLTEELADDQSRFEHDHFWCIDPLDGTLPFTEQVDGYAVSIALVNRLGIPVIGVIADPYHDHLYSAIRGKGIERDGIPLQREINVASQGLFKCYFDRSFEQSSKFELVIDWLEKKAKDVGLMVDIVIGRGAVMNAFGVFESEYGCYFKLPKQVKGGGSNWDFAATALLFEEAQLNVSDISGAQLALNSKSTFMNKRGIIYSSNDELHQSIIGFAENILTAKS